MLASKTPKNTVQSFVALVNRDCLNSNYDFGDVGDSLLAYALSKLNTKARITTNIVKSHAEPFQKEHEIFNKYNFAFSHHDLEHGVPVSCMERKPDV